MKLNQTSNAVKINFLFHDSFYLKTLFVNCPNKLVVFGHYKLLFSECVCVRIRVFLLNFVVFSRFIVATQ